jgi:hypothetical protein
MVSPELLNWVATTFPFATPTATGAPVESTSKSVALNVNETSAQVVTDPPEEVQPAGHPMQLCWLGSQYWPAAQLMSVQLVTDPPADVFPEGQAVQAVPVQ